MELPTDEYYRYVKKNSCTPTQNIRNMLAVFRGREMVFRHSHHKCFTLQIFCPIRNMLAVVRGRD